MKDTTIALIYDFDKTLCTKDMQEYSFIPGLGMEAEAFWAEANGLAREKQMDSILAYMYVMLQKAREAQKPITKKSLQKMGEKIDYFPGVLEWFDHINAYGKSLGVKIEHYIISSGLKEIIEGSRIYGAFKEIYASRYLYQSPLENRQEEALWPALSVNYTAKTQFLFRINKGVLDVSEDRRLNEVTPENERPIPFYNMIYIGDGMTDVPCMKLVKTNGGKSIAVYGGEGAKNAKDLYCSGRVNYFLPADYRPGGELETIIKQIVAQMVMNDQLIKKEKQQLKGAGCQER